MSKVEELQVDTATKILMPSSEHHHRVTVIGSRVAVRKALVQIEMVIQVTAISY